MLTNFIYQRKVCYYSNIISCPLIAINNNELVMWCLLGHRRVLHCPHTAGQDSLRQAKCPTNRRDGGRRPVAVCRNRTAAAAARRNGCSLWHWWRCDGCWQPLGDCPRLYVRGKAPWGVWQCGEVRPRGVANDQAALRCLRLDGIRYWHDFEWVLVCWMRVEVNKGSMRQPYDVMMHCTHTIKLKRCVFLCQVAIDWINVRFS